MDNPEEVMQILERFNCQRNAEKKIPQELNEYVSFVARTGDSVYAWSLVKNLFREKLVNVITEFYNEAPTKELPQYPNVDPFNYETMKKMLIDKLDSFNAAPFTIQRISELLSEPRKQYSRIDKFMRAVEKNILVVSTQEPGRHRSESENGDSLDSALNGDFSSEVNVDIDMESGDNFTMTKELSVTAHNKEQSHEIPAVSNDTVTIKKAILESLKKEQAGTSSEKLNEEEKKDSAEISEEKTANISISTPSIVSVILIEESKSLPVESSSDVSSLVPEITVTDSSQPDELPKSVELSESEPQKVDIVTSSEGDVPEIKDSSDDALSNEPIRPPDNEVLVDTTEIIGETPLAALENIVAITTDAAVEAEALHQVTPSNSTEPEPIVESSEASAIVDIPETSSKRLKIIETTEEEAPEPTSSSVVELNEPIVSPTPESIQNVPESSAEIVSTTEAIIEVIEKVNEDVVQDSTIDATTSIQEETPKEQKIEEPIPEIPEIVNIPLETAQVNKSVETTENVESPPSEMETVPIVSESTTMDDDESAQAAPTIADTELEMTPVVNKMDTDDVNNEAAMMDVDDSEPMDQ